MKRTLILLPHAAAALLLVAACQADLPAGQGGPLVPDLSAPIELSGSAPINVSSATTRAEQEIKFTLTAIPVNGNIPYFKNIIATLPNSSCEPQNISFSTQYWPLSGENLKFIGLMNGKGEAVKADINDDPTAYFKYGLLKLESGKGVEYDILMSDNLIGNRAGFNGNPTYMQFKHLTTRLIIRPGKTVQRVTCDIAGGTDLNTYRLWGSPLLVNGTEPYIISYDTDYGEQTYYLVSCIYKPENNKISELTNVKVNGQLNSPFKITDGAGKEVSLDISAGKSYVIVISSESAKLTVSDLPTFETTWEDGGIIN